MARRYGQRPSRLVLTGLDDDRLALAFDLNVMLLGLLAEARAAEQAHQGRSIGPIRSRRDAVALAERAKREVAEMERRGGNGTG